MPDPKNLEAGIWKRCQKEIIVALVIIFLFTVWMGSARNSGVEFQFGEEQMSILGPSGAPGPVVVDYTDILALYQRSGLELGSGESGLDTNKCRFGSWNNTEFGDYTLCAVPAASEYIVMETVQGTVVFNYQDDDATLHLYTALLELLESKDVVVSSYAG